MFTDTASENRTSPIDMVACKHLQVALCRKCLMWSLRDTSKQHRKINFIEIVARKQAPVASTSYRKISSELWRGTSSDAKKGTPPSCSSCAAASESWTFGLKIPREGETKSQGKERPLQKCFLVTFVSKTLLNVCEKNWNRTPIIIENGLYFFVQL